MRVTAGLNAWSAVSFSFSLFPLSCSSLAPSYFPDVPKNRKVQRCQQLGETVFIHRLFVP